MALQRSRKLSAGDSSARNVAELKAPGGRIETTAGRSALRGKSARSRLWTLLTRGSRGPGRSHGVRHFGAAHAQRFRRAGGGVARGLMLHFRVKLRAEQDDDRRDP